MLESKRKAETQSIHTVRDVHFLSTSMAPLGYEFLATAVCFVGVSSSLLLVNKLALKGMPLPSCLSALQFACSVVCVVVVLKKLGMAEADTFRWSIARSYALYVVLFCSSIYASMRAISSANLETVMVFRSFVPVLLSTIEFAFMGREAPSLRSSCALIAISAGAASYVASIASSSAAASRSMRGASHTSRSFALRSHLLSISCRPKINSGPSGGRRSTRTPSRSSR